MWRWLAVTANSFQPQWSAEIHRESMSNILDNQPDLSAERLERTMVMVDANIEDYLVAGYEGLVTGLSLFA